jgi:thiol-disulfide isomerase/thioredoxin
MVFYSQTERNFAVAPAVVLSASLIKRFNVQRNSSPFAFLRGQTGCQNHWQQAPADNFRFQYSALLMVLILLLLSACNTSRNSAPQEGDPFPLTVLTSLDSERQLTGDYSSKTLVINFWATWCEPCREEMDSLQQLSDAMDSEHFQVIGVSVDDDGNLMREFLYQQKISFDNYLDSTKKLATDSLSIRGFPETFIVSPKGVIVRRIAGKQDWNTQSVRALLESIHEGKGIPGGTANRGSVKFPEPDPAFKKG